MKPEKQLYQWDVNQYLTGINPAAQFVDYPIGDEVIRLETDGTRCRIPDEVLQTYGGKTCYERYPDGTYRAYSFPVLYAPKPPDYVFTPEERTTFEALTARVDASIDEIKRRADSGEFTPKKGVDYFTDAEKAEMMESVSDGAIGEFRKVVDSATTEYNANHNLTLAKYNANASEKLTAYDTNAEQHTTDYNRNAAEKLEAYNQNHTAKVAEYNANAETKTAEFDSNAAALQTEVDRLRGECDQLAAENRKQENRIDALMKLNKGQTYDVLQQESEAYSVDVPSGSRYMGIDKVGGKSVVWNQLFKTLISKNWIVESGVTVSEWGDNSVTYTTSIVDNGIRSLLNQTLSVGHKYLIRALVKANGACKVTFGYESDSAVYGYVNFTSATTSYAEYSGIKTCTSSSSTTVYIYSRNTGIEVSIKNLVLFDLTKMFGSTIADYIYSLEQSQAGAGVAWFKKLFPADYYPYSEPTVISSQTDRVDVASSDGTVTQQITTNFPVLNSAGSVYDYIDLNEGKLHQRVGKVDLGTLDWMVVSNTYMKSLTAPQGIKSVAEIETANVICPLYQPIALQPMRQGDNKRLAVMSDGKIFVRDSAYTDAIAFKQAMSGVMLYYEIADEVITDIEIPTEFTDWLTVEAGGSVTFHNSDESKHLPVPNAVSWVRKLNEVE